MIETKLDPKEERKYERLRELAQELHLPIPEVFIELEVRDKAGNVIQRHHQRSHSWVRNAYNIMMCQLASLDGDDSTFEAGKLSIKTIAGVIRYSDKPPGMSVASTCEGTFRGFRAGAGVDDFGILVGSGTNAESFEDFALQTPIVEGTAAGELNHAAAEAMNESYGALVFSNELVRFFNNNSGGNVSINEVALAGGITAGGVAGQYVVYSRDKLASTVTVPDTGQLKVTYTVQLTYPS